jgi:hypothetical protein
LLPKSVTGSQRARIGTFRLDDARLFAGRTHRPVSSSPSGKREHRPLASERPGRSNHQGGPPAAVGEPQEPAGLAPYEDATHTVFADRGERDHRNGATADAAPDAAVACADLPVSFRPTPASPSRQAGGGSHSSPACGDLGKFPGSRKIVFSLPKETCPLAKTTEGTVRPQGGHEGTETSRRHHPTTSTRRTRINTCPKPTNSALRATPKPRRPSPKSRASNRPWRLCTRDDG